VYIRTSHGYTEIGAFFSSGGFSNDFGIPEWQASNVKYYLENAPNLPAPSFYNASGRALPDVSVVGVNVMIILDGVPQSVDGTSCSSPMFAGMVSLLNGVRLQAGKNPLGFINPLLYSSFNEDPTSFFDVTQGYNGEGCCPGFNATKGWDPVTGLGTPNFEVLLKIVEQLK